MQMTKQGKRLEDEEPNYYKFDIWGSRLPTNTSNLSEVIRNYKNRMPKVEEPMRLFVTQAIRLSPGQLASIEYTSISVHK